MSRYINANAIEYHEIYDGQGFVRVAYGDDIDNIPTADVVAVVRCGHCEYYKNTICQNPNGLPRYLDENEFCSNGKRREASNEQFS